MFEGGEEIPQPVDSTPPSAEIESASPEPDESSTSSTRGENVEPEAGTDQSEQEVERDDASAQSSAEGVQKSAGDQNERPKVPELSQEAQARIEERIQSSDEIDKLYAKGVAVVCSLSNYECAELFSNDEDGLKEFERAREQVLENSALLKDRSRYFNQLYNGEDSLNKRSIETDGGVVIVDLNSKHVLRLDDDGNLIPTNIPSGAVSAEGDTTTFYETIDLSKQYDPMIQAMRRIQPGHPRYADVQETLAMLDMYGQRDESGRVIGINMELYNHNQIIRTPEKNNDLKMIQRRDEQMEAIEGLLAGVVKDNELLPNLRRVNRAMAEKVRLCLVKYIYAREVAKETNNDGAKLLFQLEALNSLPNDVLTEIGKMYLSGDLREKYDVIIEDRQKRERSIASEFRDGYIDKQPQIIKYIIKPLLEDEQLNRRLQFVIRKLREGKPSEVVESMGALLENPENRNNQDVLTAVSQFTERIFGERSNITTEDVERLMNEITDSAFILKLLKFGLREREGVIPGKGGFLIALMMIVGQLQQFAEEAEALSGGRGGRK